MNGNFLSPPCEPGVCTRSEMCILAWRSRRHVPQPCTRPDAVPHMGEAGGGEGCVAQEFAFEKKQCELNAHMNYNISQETAPLLNQNIYHHLWDPSSPHMCMLRKKKWGTQNLRPVAVPLGPFVADVCSLWSRNRRRACSRVKCITPGKVSSQSLGGKGLLRSVPP